LLVQEAEGQGWPLVRGRYPVVAIKRDAEAPARLVCGEEVVALAAILLALAGWVRERGEEIGRGETVAAYEVEACGHQVRVTTSKSIPD
jgi:hypothetical protein